MSPHLKNIIVIGGSFVGSRAAAEIARLSPATHRVFLIEPHSHFQHLFVFPRFAVVGGYEQKAFIPFDGFFQAEGVKGTIVRAAVERLEKGKALFDREIDVGGITGREIDYDYAVIATGTKLPPPGTLKVEEKIDGVKYFREHQQRVSNAERIVILGAGAVGVQMATDIKDIFPNKRVTLVHSRQQVLNRFHPDLHALTMKRFNELGVEVILGDRAVIPAEGFPVEGEFEVELQSGKKIPADFAIISIGQTPQSSILEALSPTSIKPNRFISVKPTLQISDPDYPNIFAVGDIADSGANKAARPGIAQAKMAANNIVRLIEGKGEELETYEPGNAAIHLTLGVKSNVIFANPRHGAEPPWCEEKDDGVLDMGVEKRWKSMGAPLNDFHA
ncbi:FAD/NAD-P-binding domain-containing protein [Hysterangium stoloniferum]|nr:FAD/NAD-P-binding domain-containing protein [Hysterangium stoloniferum]